MTDEEEKEVSLKEKKFDLKGMVSRKNLIGISVVAGLILLVVLVVKSCEPAKGNVLYGICGAFLEQQIEFPEIIEHQYVEHYPFAVRIYYSHIDGFGQYLTEFIECSFEKPPNKGLQMKAIVFNTIKEITRKIPVKNKGRLYAVEQKHIDHFNKSNSISIIIEQKPDLTLPARRSIAL